MLAFPNVQVPEPSLVSVPLPVPMELVSAPLPLPIKFKFVFVPVTLPDNVNKPPEASMVAPEPVNPIVRFVLAALPPVYCNTPDAPIFKTVPAPIELAEPLFAKAVTFNVPEEIVVAPV